jgi:hypothetical protein
MDVARLNSKCVSRDNNQDKSQEDISKVVLLLAIQENEYREKNRKSSNVNQPLFIYSSFVTSESSSMLRCTNRIIIP